MDTSHDDRKDEARALLGALDQVAPSAPTACAGWSAHDIVAHLAAGSKEIADLIEEKLAGRPSRPTRAFEEREPPFRALADDELRAAWSRESRRKTEAVAALGALGEDATFDFTGTALTAERITLHSRSEAAIHRWDVAGDDDVSEEQLSRPKLTAHAVSVLNAMPVLAESAAARARLGGDHPPRIVLRAPDHPDVVLVGQQSGAARFELVEEGSAEGDAVVVTGAAHRLLVLWGRRSTTRPLALRADHATSDLVASVLWPNAIAWP